uniref:Uncharacterized protein n=1 Tax=Picea sitchensis TaxID=3332 RepID=A0A6B9XZ33_PICSI|nr:hypothetical protein Q903MT_gene6733 [Picea sitchensis]
MSELPKEGEEPIDNDSLPDGHIFLIDSNDPWYGNSLVYLQTQRVPPQCSREDRRRIRHHAKHYIIIGDTLYHRGVDSILRRCLTHEEA